MGNAISNKKEVSLKDLLKIVAPGTRLREALDNILNAGTGALIVVGDTKEVLEIVDGGFYIDKEFEPAHLYELAKMDGAIIITEDLKRILYANALLIPEPTIQTSETGTRHKSAERTAKQTGNLVISISQRRGVITLYKGDNKYVLKEPKNTLSRANQALQTLEKYKSVIESNLTNLSILEFEDIVSLYDVALILQRTEMALRIIEEIEGYICELGIEGRLISMQLEELKPNIRENAILVIEDYMSKKLKESSEEIMNKIEELSTEDMLDISSFVKVIGHYKGSESLEQNISPRGYRILSRLPRLPMVIQSNLVKEFNNFQGILNATAEKLDEVEGIGEARAMTIRQGLRKVQDQLMLDSRYVL